MDLLSLLERCSERQIRYGELIPKDSIHVTVLYGRGFYGYLNDLMFAGHEIVVAALSKLTIQQIKRHGLYGMLFSAISLYKFLDVEYLLKFVETDYPFQRVPYKIPDPEKLLERSLTNPALQQWLEVQNIRLPTNEDLSCRRNIPSSQILRDAVNDRLYDQQLYRLMLLRDRVDLLKFYIRRGIIPTDFQYESKLNFIVAYETIQNDDFILRNLEFFCREFTFKMFTCKFPLCRLFALLAPHLNLTTANLLDDFQTRNHQCSVIIGRNIDWKSVHDDKIFTTKFLYESRLPLAYRRHRPLTPNILLSYLREGFPVDYEFLRNKHHRHLLESPEIQRFLEFSQRETWQPYHFSVMNSEHREIVHQLALIRSVEGNVLHLIPPELFFLIIDFLIV